MKKLNAKTLLGLVVATAGVVSSYGQGSIWLDNYNAAGSPRINWGAGVPGKTQGTGVDDPSMKAILYFQLGTVADPAGVGNIGGGFAAASPGTTFLAGAPGYLSGVIDTIPGYTSGAVTFEIAVFNGTDYASSAIRGHSAAVTLNAIATGTTLPGFLDGLASFQAAQVPEPSTFALLGLGTGALLFLRRRK